LKNIIKSAIGFAVIMLASQSFAGTINNVYIDQVGSGSTITLNQQGSNNEIGNDTTATTLHGNGQTVSISQVGSGNTNKVNVQGANSVINSTVTGDNNNTTVACGAAPSSSCNDTAITANISGSSNNTSITAGSKSTVTAEINGSTNNTSIESKTTNLMGAGVGVKETGDSNMVNINQNGPAGANGFVSKVEVTGASNNVAVTQSGTTDSTVNIKSTGSNNSISVTSSN
jgi:hypothetical protein